MAQEPPMAQEPITESWLIARYATPDPALDSGPLAGVLDVAWAQIGQAYGDASCIPALLRAILGPTFHHRELAIQLLYSAVWHQGTIYHASAAVLPFLTQMLGYTDDFGKTVCLDLIAIIAQSSVQMTSSMPTESDIRLRMPWLVKEGMTIEAYRLEERAVGQDCYAAALVGVPAYLRLLDAPDHEVAAFARHTLSLLADAASATIPPLLERLGSDESDMRGHTLLALDALAQPGAAGAALFEPLLPHEPSAALRQILALAIFRRRGAQAAPEVIEMVLDTCAALGPSSRNADGAWATDARLFPQPWQIDRAEALADALAAAGPDLLQRGLQAAANDDVAFCLALRLLDLVFERTVRRISSQHSWAGDGRRKIHYPASAKAAPLSSPQLAPQQADALGAVLASSPLWQIESDVLGCYGLPASRAGLRAFLAGR